MENMEMCPYWELNIEKKSMARLETFMQKDVQRNVL